METPLPDSKPPGSNPRIGESLRRRRFSVETCPATVLHPPANGVTATLRLRSDTGARWLPGGQGLAFGVQTGTLSSGAASNEAGMCLMGKELMI